MAPSNTSRHGNETQPVRRLHVNGRTIDQLP
jgi:hypothetical protein